MKHSEILGWVMGLFIGLAVIMAGSVALVESVMGLP
jgi:hypothetical protein